MTDVTKHDRKKYPQIAFLLCNFHRLDARIHMAMLPGL